MIEKETARSDLVNKVTKCKQLWIDLAKDLNKRQKTMKKLFTIRKINLIKMTPIAHRNLQNHCDSNQIIKDNCFSDFKKNSKFHMETSTVILNKKLELELS